MWRIDCRGKVETTQWLVSSTHSLPTSTPSPILCYYLQFLPHLIPELLLWSHKWSSWILLNLSSRKLHKFEQAIPLLKSSVAPHPIWTKYNFFCLKIKAPPSKLTSHCCFSHTPNLKSYYTTQLPVCASCLPTSKLFAQPVPFSHKAFSHHPPSP